MYKWYEYSEIIAIRRAVRRRLQLPAAEQGEEEPATAFWEQVEKAGLLGKALALYDEVAAEHAARRQVRRETKREFEHRMEREGRQAEAERLRAELLASGLSQREAQAALVERLQPLDGSGTRVWETPDPWQAGRLFLKKAEQDRLLQEAGEGDKSAAAASARWRVECARWRREERLALAAARRRARALELAAAE
jgi:hypothetical protein